MSINGYEYTKLSEEELAQIANLEKKLNEKKKDDKEIILLAFDRKN